MAIPLNDNTRVLAPKPTDPRYFANDNTPWDSIIAVNAGLPSGERHEGLTVNIAGVEYWWKDGVWVVKFDNNPKFKSLENYQDMLDYHTSSGFFIYEILNDEDKNYNRSTYLWKPNGDREWLASTPDNDNSTDIDNLEQTIIFKSKDTYALMIGDGKPFFPTMYSITNDENKSYERSTYLWKPNGNREWLASTPDN